MKYTVKKLNKGDTIEQTGRVTIRATNNCYAVVDENGNVRKSIINGKAVYDQYNLKVAAEKQADFLNK